MLEYIDERRVAGVIRMERNNPRFRDATVLIVEGPNDSKLFKTLINRKHCFVESAGNKENAIKALELLKKDGYRGILAIVDADLDTLQNTTIDNPDLFYTDTHDLETMIIQSEAFDHFLQNRCDLEKTSDFFAGINEDEVAGYLRKWLIDLAKPLGYIRWFSIRNFHKLKFSDLTLEDFKTFVNIASSQIDIKRALQIIIRYTGTTPFTKKELLNESTKLGARNPDIWQLLHGHDLTKILILGLQRKFGWGTQHLNERDIETELRLCYQMGYFIKTQLYKKICNWTALNPPYSVFD